MLNSYHAEILAKYAGASLRGCRHARIGWWRVAGIRTPCESYCMCKCLCTGCCCIYACMGVACTELYKNCTEYGLVSNSIARSTGKYLFSEKFRGPLHITCVTDHAKEDIKHWSLIELCPLKQTSAPIGWGSLLKVYTAHWKTPSRGIHLAKSLTQHVLG